MAGRFNVETVFKGIDRISSVVRRIEQRTGISTQRMGRMFRQLDRGFSSLVGGAGRAAKAAAAIGIAGGIAAVQIGRTGADFEQAISAVGAVSLQSRKEISALEDKARELGAKTQFTATEAANAMEIMARAGFKNHEILAGVSGILDAASASGLEIAEVADHVSNALKGMGLEVTDAKTGMSNAAMVADVLALASSKTNSSIGSLGESLRNVSSTASQFNIPFHEVVSGVALLQDVGLDASVAGSALNVMLTKLAKPPAELARQMEKFGLSFKTAEGNMKSFPEVLQTISEAAKKQNGNMDQAAFLADLVGLRGQKAAAQLKTLFEKGKFKELADELAHAQGKAQEMAELRMDNLLGDFTKLSSAVDDVKISLFQTESGPLRDTVQAFTDWVSNNKGLAVERFERFMKVVKPLGSIFSKEFGATLGAIGEGFRSMFPPSEETAGEWQRALKELAKNLGQIAAVVAVVVAGVAAVIVGIGLTISTLWSTIRGVGEGITNFLGERIFGLLDWFADLKAMFSSEGLSLGEKFVAIGKHMVMGLVRGIRSLAMAPVDAIRDIGGGALRGLKNALGIHSPSRKMEKLGRFTGEGYELGILHSLPRITGALSQMSHLTNMAPANQNAAHLTTAGASRVDGEILVRAQEGSKAEVTERPSAGVSLRVARTGTF